MQEREGSRPISSAKSIHYFGVALQKRDDYCDFFESDHFWDGVGLLDSQNTLRKIVVNNMKLKLESTYTEKTVDFNLVNLVNKVETLQGWNRQFFRCMGSTWNISSFIQAGFTSIAHLQEFGQHIEHQLDHFIPYYFLSSQDELHFTSRVLKRVAQGRVFVSIAHVAQGRVFVSIAHA